MRMCLFSARICTFFCSFVKLFSTHQTQQRCWTHFQQLSFPLHSDLNCVIIPSLSVAQRVVTFPVCFQGEKCSQKLENGKVSDLKWAMCFMTAMAAGMAVLIICGFWPRYKRLEIEAAEKILRINNQQGLPTISDGPSEDYDSPPNR